MKVGAGGPTAPIPLVTEGNARSPTKSARLIGVAARLYRFHPLFITHWPLTH